MYNPFSLTGKTILVTGASSGIGRATAVECSKMGATLILTARNEERLQATLAELDGDGHRYILADLTDETQMQTLCEGLPELDGVVFCAGKSLLKPIQVLSEKDITSVFATNYTAPVLLTKSLVKARKLNKGASLVYIASISGNGNTAPALAIYGSSKSSLTSFVQYAALELAGRQIRCNAICPGRIETGLLQNQSMTAEEIQKDIDKYPLRRYGKPEEVAQAAVYLLSDAAQWMTGTALKLDGGRTLS
jgi:NAD(P)-dependent dehydrogenase (short-subunit alcohol dehydrogenase family)